MSKNNNILNPLISEAPVKKIGEIKANFLTKRYKKQYNITVQFNNLTSIEIYECLESGYQFFYPLNLAGDSAFYEILQNYNWYYMPWKWEHEISSKFIKENDKVLEIGPGKGAFLKKISQTFESIECVGLELNESSVYKDDKVEIINQSIEEHILDNVNKYSVVCSFQVLEHVAYVKSFIESSVKALTDDGLLIICVPNNGGFIKDDKLNILNMPPHHMGLWNEESLSYLSTIFNLKLEHIITQPLQQQHYSWYIEIVLRKYIGKYFARGINLSIDWLFLRKFVNERLAKKANKIKGHSIISIYRKMKEN